MTHLGISQYCSGFQQTILIFQTGIEIQEILHTGFYLYGWKRSLELTRLLRSQGYIINSSGSQQFTIPLQLPSKIEIT